MSRKGSLVPPAGDSTQIHRKNVLKKPAFWLVSAAVIVVAAGIVFLLSKIVQTIELPDESVVIAVEREQFNEMTSAGRVTITVLKR